jgi:hypothetical protein
MTCLLLAAPLCLLLSGAAPAAAPAPGATSAATTPASPVPATPASPSMLSARLLDPSAAWRGARWGMTVAEVLQAFPNEAIRLEPAERLADGKVIAAGIESHAIGELSFRVRFLFEGGRLALVSLKNLPSRLAVGGDYDALSQRLAAETGQPGEERPRDSSFDYREVRFAAGGTALDLKFLEGALVLLFHPLQGGPGER